MGGPPRRGCSSRRSEAEAGGGIVTRSSWGKSPRQEIKVGIADLQDKIYRQIQAMKEFYFTELDELYQRVVLKIQQHDTFSQSAEQSERFEKIKNFKLMLERVLEFLQISKSAIWPALKDKLALYEKQLVNVIAIKTKRKISRPTIANPS